MAALDDLVKRLAGYAPTRVLALGPSATRLAEPLAAEHPGCEIESVDEAGDLPPQALLDAVALRGRLDLAIVGDELERLDAEAGGNLIARLRDVHAARLCVMVARDCPEWQAARLVALALSRWGEVDLAGRALVVYGYDIGTYKKTPDWLNPKHWAHPENWGKYRW